MLRNLMNKVQCNKFSKEIVINKSKVLVFRKHLSHIMLKSQFESINLEQPHATKIREIQARQSTQQTGRNILFHIYTLKGAK